MRRLFLPIFLVMFLFVFANQSRAADPPTVSSISPTNGSTAGGTSVTITGTNFIAGNYATGGAVTYTDSNGLNPRVSPAYSDGYTVHTFTTSGTFQALSRIENLEYLVVAGGGGGGNCSAYSSADAGGGGAGGLLTGTTTITAGNKTVTVGNGGSAGSPNVRGGSGGNSVFDTITATGGGGGGSSGTVTINGGGNGGSGGGATYGASGAAAGLGTAGQGYDGNIGGLIGGGGGGAGALGVSGSTSTGYGGDGIGSSISGVSTYYAGGGGGGNEGGATPLGGLGGGGNGSTSAAAGVSGTANTGGGGGGGSTHNSSLGSSGGSGIVIVRYRSTENPEVQFDGISASNIQVLNSTTITATTPAHASGATNVVVTNYDGQAATLTNGYTYNNPPTISSVTPSSAIKTGGDTVTISGTNFIETPTVTFGGTNATSVTRINSTTLNVVVPAHAVGTVDVVVVNPDSQSATLTNGFTYTELPPTVSSISPTSGSTLGGTSTAISGTNLGLDNDTNTKLLLHGDGSGASFSDFSSNPKTITASGNATQSATQSKFGGKSVYFDGSGDYLQTASSADLGFGTGDFTIEMWYRPTSRMTTYPNILNNGYVWGVNEWGLCDRHAATPTKFSIYVYNFNTTTPILQSATTVVDNNWYHLAITRSGSSFRFFVNGVLESTYTNSGNFDGGSSTFLITGAGSGGAADAYINGYIDELRISKGIARWTSNFTPSTVPYANPNVTFGGTQATNISITSLTSIAATTPAHASGLADVTVTNPDSQSATLTNGYTYIAPPTISSIAPASVLKTGGDTVTITGSEFYGTPTVTFGGTSATSVTLINPTTLSVTVPAHAVGTVDVVVVNPDSQSATLTNGITYTELPPTVSSISPTDGPTAGGTSVTITGTNFLGGNDSDTKLLLHGDGSEQIFLDSSQANGTVTAGGNATQVSTQSKFGGKSIYFDGSGDYLSVPALGVRSADFTIETFFRPAVIGTAHILATTYNLPTQANTLIFSVGADGKVSVNNGVTGTTSTTTLAANNWYHLAIVYTHSSATTKLYVNGVLEATLSGISFTSEAANFYIGASPGDNNLGSYWTNGWMDEFRVSGSARWTSNFTSPTVPYYVAPAVSFGSMAATNVNFVNSTTITATTPAHAAGATDVVVTNQDSQSATLTNGYTYIAPPTISSVTPSSAIKTGGDTVTINGTDFVATPTVTFGGTAATSVTFVNSTTLSVVVPTHLSGTVDVIVTNPDTSNDILVGGFTFTEAPPVISSINPGNGSAMGGTSVTINGSGFYMENFGSGADGAITISANKDINTDIIAGGRTCADAINYSVTVLTSNTATLSTTPAAGCISAGDEILLINLQGTSSKYDNVGNYETLTVQSLNTNIVTFVSNKTKYYGDDVNSDTNIGTAVTNQRVMLQRVPNYTNVTINPGYTLTASMWDGTKGGIMYFRASGAIANNGTITMSGRGFAGGVAVGSGRDQVGYQGASYASSGIKSMSKNFNGSGGGGASGFYCGAGSGGGYASVGSAGSSDYTSGTPGDPVGADNLSKVILGGGGGGGGTGYDGSCSAAGGRGAGAIFLAANQINNTGTISASGNNGSNGFYGSRHDCAPGGGGAGGTIYLTVNNLISGTTVALGGSGGTDSQSYGGAGSEGRIRVDYISKSGTTNPAAYYNQNNFSVFFGGVPSTSISSVSSNSIVVVSPAHAVGYVDVVVTNQDEQSDTLENSYAFTMQPTVSSINPPGATKNGGRKVSISGDNFYGSPSVTFDGVPAVSVNLINASTLSVDVPAHVPGVVDVIVTNPLGEVATFANSFTYTEPEMLHGTIRTVGRIKMNQ